MALGTLIAGHSTGTLASVALGMTRQGYELEVVQKQEPVDESDVFGLSTIDWVIRGADCFMSAMFKEYKAGPISAIWGPWAAGAIGKLMTSSTPMSRLASDTAAALVLTAAANTPAAATPASLTASKALLAPGYNPKILFDSRLRELPMRLMLLPYSSSTDHIFFSTT